MKEKKTTVKPVKAVKTVKKSAKVAKAAPVGRPTKYKTEYIDLAYKFCLLGATDAELGDFFDVCEETINDWKRVYPEFSASIKKGKEIADATVASKLYHRATGYEHPDVDIKMYEGRIIETPLVKHYPPDTTAGIFWLKNRQHKKWRDKVEVASTSKVEVTEKPDSSKLTTEELRSLIELQRKAKTKAK